MGELLLGHSDNLSRSLQSPHLSAAEGQKVAAMTVQTLQSLHSEENFWCNTVQKANDLYVADSALPIEGKGTKQVWNWNRRRQLSGRH